MRAEFSCAASAAPTKTPCCKREAVLLTPSWMNAVGTSPPGVPPHIIPSLSSVVWGEYILLRR